MHRPGTESGTDWVHWCILAQYCKAGRQGGLQSLIDSMAYAARGPGARRVPAKTDSDLPDARLIQCNRHRYRPVQTQIQTLHQDSRASYVGHFDNCTCVTIWHCHSVSLSESRSGVAELKVGARAACQIIRQFMKESSVHSTPAARVKRSHSRRRGLALAEERLVRLGCAYS